MCFVPLWRRCGVASGQPQRRYYCEYCDKSFICVDGARRKHFHGRSHRNNVKMYYDAVRGEVQQRDCGRSRGGRGRESIGVEKWEPPGSYREAPSALCERV